MESKIRKAALLTLGMAALSSSIIGNPYNTKEYDIIIILIIK